MKRILSSLILALAFAMPAFAQTVPLPYQGSAAAEATHLFTGTTLIDLSVSWGSGDTSARFLMIFDSNSASTYSATPCSVTQVNGCLLYCMYVPNSTAGPSGNSFDWVMHPMRGRNGILAALSTGGTCGTYTADSASNFYYAQVSY
jgi:hypothetical protein